MTTSNEVVFLLDVDNKLRILAAMKKVWGDRLTSLFKHIRISRNNLEGVSHDAYENIRKPVE